MIRVTPAPEPEDFDERVRQPGLRAIAELVGEGTREGRRRRGRPRAQVAARPVEIPATTFPKFWTRAIEDLRRLYDGICAYLCVFIEPVTGASTVDHFLPKSRHLDQVYEWRNYRLACSLMNARKGEDESILDPFALEDGWFRLELTGFQVVPNPDLDDATRQRVEHTIQTLGLGDPECRALREQYAEDYWQGLISLNYLRLRSPFLARELERQGRLRREDEEPARGISGLDHRSAPGP